MTSKLYCIQNRYTTFIADAMSVPPPMMMPPNMMPPHMLGAVRHGHDAAHAATASVSSAHDAAHDASASFVSSRHGHNIGGSCCGGGPSSPRRCHGSTKANISSVQVSIVRGRPYKNPSNFFLKLAVRRRALLIIFFLNDSYVNSVLGYFR